MPHTIERAPTGRAKCRGCGGHIVKGGWRVGDAVPNPFADQEGAESLHWYHPECAAYKRPETFLAVYEAADEPLPDRDALEAAARLGVEHHRLVRVDRAERAPSGRAACRACKTPIEKGSWRMALVFYEDGRFAPSGYLHPGCAREYLGSADLRARLRRFTDGLTEDDLDEIARIIG